jgi:hypothetical protein
MGTKDPERSEPSFLESGAGKQMVITKSPVDIEVIANAVELACRAPSARGLRLGSDGVAHEGLMPLAAGGDTPQSRCQRESGNR